MTSQKSQFTSGMSTSRNSRVHDIEIQHFTLHIKDQRHLFKHLEFVEQQLYRAWTVVNAGDRYCSNAAMPRNKHACLTPNTPPL